jgi:hypothetical protein
MTTIIIYDNRPIYATNDSIIDWWKVGKALERHSSFIPDLDEFRRSPDVFIHQMIIGYDLFTWKWNKIQNDWIIAN